MIQQMAMAMAVSAGLMFTHAAPVSAEAASESSTSSPMTADLCSSRRVPCAVQVGGVIREGAATSVYVTGRPGATVQVQLFKLDVVGARITTMAPLGKPVDAQLNDSGQGRAAVPVAPFPVDQQGGWVLASLADATWTGNPERIVGQIVPIGGRVPTVLGDGYGSQKPVSTVLDQQITNYIDGTRFSVEYLGDDGSWRNVTRGTAERSDDGSTIMVLRYAVPNGLLDKPYRFRAHNLSDPSAVDAEWVVVPSTQAAPQDRAPLLDVPVLGAGVSTGAGAPRYSSARVVGVVSVVLVLGLAAMVLWPARAIRRRRIDVAAP